MGRDSPVPDDANAILLVRFEQLIDQLATVIATSLLTATVVTIALSDRLDAIDLTIWWLLAVVLAAVRLVHLGAWRRRSGTLQRPAVEIAWATLYSGLSGCLWGALGVLVVAPEHPLVNLVTIMVLTGLVASATASLSGLSSVYLAFVLPAMLPVAVVFVGYEDVLYRWIALLIVLYLVVGAVFAAGIRRTLIRSIELRFANRALVEDLDAKRRVAERSVAAKSTFLAAASHDLRQPLQALRLFASAMRTESNAVRRERLLRHVERSVSALEDLFGGILDISRLDAGTIEVDRIDCRIDGLMERAVGECGALAGEKGLSLRLVAEPYVVDTDPHLFERVLRNVLDNAVAYTSSGEIAIDLHDDGKRAFLTVRDSGCGISSADRERVFDEFVQVGNIERDRSRGVGLGLSIVARLCELLDIGLSLESEPGVGTTVRLALPRGRAVLCRAVASENAIDFPSLGPLFVVVIEDDTDVREALKLVLAGWGCVVQTAASTDEACRQLRAFEYAPDALIADLRLRGGASGVEGIHTLRRHFAPDAPGLILTGDIASARLREVHDSGLPVLHKPCDLAALHAFLARESAHT